MHVTLLALWATSFALPGCVLAQDSGPTVTIEAGSLRGRSTQAPTSDKTVNQFFGIPLAQPPVGGLRFKPPQKPEPWTEPLAVDEHPKACPQLFGTPGPGAELAQALFNDPPFEAEEDEDCLYLNVFVPEGGASDKPVLFWIHGGSGITGGVSSPMYDSTDLVAEQDIIVVMSQYRLGFYGNPGAPDGALPINESSLALLDQRLALSWIQDNVAAFGGDPKKVTVMGESAGGIAVGHFVNTYPENPPFRAAIEMSGSTVALAGMSVPSVEKGADNWQKIVEGLDCASSGDASAQLSCIKDKDSKTIMTFLNDNNIRLMGTQPDNITQLERPDVAWSEGNVARVPLLIGSTAHDASYWVVAPILNLQEAAGSSGDNSSSTTAIPTVSDLLRSELKISEEQAALVEEVYGPDSPYYKGPNDTVSVVTAIGTDYTFRCTSGFVANVTSTFLQEPVWQYDFTAITPSTTFAEAPQLGAYHASELAFIFGTYNLTGKATEVDVELSKSMQAQWAGFVKDPAGAGPGWAQYPQIGVIGVQDGEPTMQEVDGREWAPACQLFNGLYLQELPALASSMASGNGSSTGGAGGGASAEGEEQGSAESSTGTAAGTSLQYNAVFAMGSVAFGLVAFM